MAVSRRDRVVATGGFLTLALLIAVFVGLGGEAVAKTPWTDAEFWNGNLSSTGAARSMLATLTLLGIAAGFSIPIGVAAAFYREECEVGELFGRGFDWCLTTLAMIPSALWGLCIFVYLGSGTNSLGYGGLALGVLMLPVVTQTTRRALRDIPQELRESSLALGATSGWSWFRVLIPKAAPVVFSGILLALARAGGEAAPLLIIGSCVHSVEASWGVCAALPVAIFRQLWSGESGVVGFASGAVVILLVLIFIFDRLIGLLSMGRVHER